MFNQAKDVRSGPCRRNTKSYQWKSVEQGDKASLDDERPSEDTSIVVAPGRKNALTTLSSESPILRMQD